MKSTAETSSGWSIQAGPDFTCGDRNRARSLHPLDELDKIVGADLGTEHGFVADHDGVDVAVAAGEVESGMDFPLVADIVLADPGADGDFETEFGGDRRHELGAAGRRIRADRARIRRDRLQVGADLFGGWPVAGIGMLGVGEGRVGDAGELTGEVRSCRFRSRHSPHAGMHARNEREHGSDGAHDF